MFGRHVDNISQDGRVLTCVIYLTEGPWDISNGGCLRVHGATGPVDVPPDEGRVVFFFADEMPHEVLPSFEQRLSVNCWFYDPDQLAQARAKGANA